MASLFSCCRQIERQDDNQNEPTETPNHNNQESSNNFRSSDHDAEINLIQQNQMNSRISSLNSNSSTGLRSSSNDAVDVLDHFDSDDDFDQNIDYGVLDEIENSQRQVSEMMNFFIFFRVYIFLSV